VTKLAKNPTSKFLKVKCSDCGSEQITFNRAVSRVNCQVCGATLLEPTGGLATVKGEVVGTLE
jgi:small subunit ribosomal protein S27e